MSLFAEPATQTEAPPWKIMVVDDDDQVHQLSRMVLRDLVFLDRPIQIVEAFSAAEAKERLREHQDIALILLDVVMETTHAGLGLVEYIREELHNGVVRIILRTGQPGEAPKKDVIQKYQINDYKTKTELTVDRLYTSVFTALRSYTTLQELNSYKASLEEQVQTRTRELEQANETLNRFFSIIAHDLRKPFNGLIGLSQHLREQMESMDDAEKQECIELILQTSQSTYQLLENLLSWANLQSGKLEARPEAFSLKAKLSDSIRSLRGALSEKQITLDNRLPGNAEIYADPEMIATIIRNLLSNAVKFTPRGGTVTLEAAPGPEEGQTAVSVTDTGVGIEPESLESLFQAGEAESTPGTEQEEGSGLGLVLCREMTKKNGGVLTVQSTPGKGSTFTLTLPASPG